MTRTVTRRRSTVGDVFATIGAVLVILATSAIVGYVGGIILDWALSDEAIHVLSLGWLPDWVRGILRLAMLIVLVRLAWKAVRLSR
jgi:hypothetical protein